MPTYDYRCKKCGKEFEAFAHIEVCEDRKCACGGDTEILIKPRRHVGIIIWKPYWEENITHQPVLVESKQHLKELCDKHGVHAARLD